MNWKPLDTPRAVETFVEHFGGFHDAYLKEFHFLAPGSLNETSFGLNCDDKPLLRMYFQGSPKAVELLFVGNIRMSLLESPAWSWYEQIDEARIYYQDNLVIWTTELHLDCREELDTREPWIAASKCFWKEVDWTGNRLRYLDPGLEVLQDQDLG